MKQIDASQAVSSSVKSLEKLGRQVVAHGKKFQFIISQISQFSDHFSTISTPTPFTPDQSAAYSDIISITRELTALLGRYLLHSWTASVVDDPSSSVAQDLWALTTRLRNSCSVLDAAGSNSFDPNSIEWHQFHILDLKSISASFAKHLSSSRGTAEDSLISAKLDSIHRWLKENNDSEFVSGSRLFSPIPVHYQSWKLAHSDFTTEEEIAIGSTATVYHGRDRRSGAEVAVKILKFAKLRGARLLTFQREVAMLAAAHHPNLVQFVGATDSPPFAIVTGWESGGSLWHELHKQSRLNETQLTIVAIDIARGMQFLHNCQMIHRDLKSLNVLLNGEGCAKICDFGLTRKQSKESRMTGNIGTPHWMAPEVLEGNVFYDEKVDVYSYGIILWEIITRKSPYPGLEAAQIMAGVVVNGLRPPLPSGLSRATECLVEACWAQNPQDRPSFSSVIRSFRSGEIELVPGSDAAAVAAHLAANSEAAIAAGENLDALHKRLSRDGIPDDDVEECWKLVMAHPEPPDLFARCLLLFLRSSLDLRAAEFLRGLPNGAIPQDVAVAAAGLLPTGKEKLNQHLVVIGCKNGAAEEVAKHVLHPDHLKLAIEVIAHVGVSGSRNREDIKRRCLVCLDASDHSVIAAALRCLIAIDEAKTVPIDTVLALTNARTLTLKMLAYVALAKMCAEGVVLPIDALEVVFGKLEDSPLAMAAIVQSCKSERNANWIVEKAIRGEITEGVLWVRVMAQAVKHDNLKDVVKVAIQAAPLFQDVPDFDRILEKLGRKLG